MNYEYTYRGVNVRKMLYTAIAVAMVLMLVIPSTVALSGYGVNEYKVGQMEVSKKIATLRAVAVTDETLIVDGTLVNMSTFTQPRPLESQAVFAGLFYRRTDNFTSYTIHYALMDMATFMERHQEGEWGLGNFSDETTVQGMTPDDMKDLVKDRSKMMELMKESKEVCGEATENGVIQVFRYLNGTVYIHVTDNANGTIKALIEQQLGVILQQYGDSPVTWYNVTTSDVVDVKVGVAIELLSGIWGDRGGLLPTVLSYIETESEPLKTYFGIHEAMFVTPSTTIDFCSFIGTTMARESFEDFVSYLDGQEFSLKVIVRSILEAEEGEYTEEELTAMKERLHGPAVERIVDAVRETRRVSVNECVLVNLENGKLEIEKEGKVVIKIEAEGNITLVSRVHNASDVQDILDKLPEDLILATEVVLDIDSEEVSGELTIKIKIPEGIPPEEVKIAYYDESTGTWNVVSTTVVVENGEYYAVVVTTHTSLWTLVTSAEEAPEGLASYYPIIGIALIIVIVVASYLVLKRRKT
jgi:hypothetical protein